MHAYWQLVSARVVARHRAGRIKQWLHYLRRAYPEARELYDELRIVNDVRIVGPRLQALSLGAAPHS